MNKKETKELVEFAGLSGRIMLENGAETYRVEETIERIIASRGHEEVQCFVVPTGIFVSVSCDDDLMTVINRVYKINIDLMHITRVNELSRAFVSSDMTIKEANRILKSIERSSQYPFWLRIAATGLAGSFMTLLFKGGPVEFAGAFLTSMLVALTMTMLNQSNVPIFIKNVFGGAATAVATIAYMFLVRHLGFSVQLGILIIGCTQQLVPGVAITNAVRDSITGDYVSGMSRTSEAFIVALGIAFGVGIAMNIASALLGGL